MRREAKILTVTLICGAVAAWGDRVPEFLRSMDRFRIAPEKIIVSGLRTLARAEVLAAMAMGSEPSVWGDVRAWEEHLTAHPMVRDARVERVFPDGLRVQVEERRPVALVPTPLIRAVDADGVILPLDPARHRLDLPILRPRTPLAPGSRVLPENLRTLAREVARIMSADSTFRQMVSEVRPGRPGTFVARWSSPSVAFVLPYGLSQLRLREGLMAMADAAVRSGAPPRVVDLQYADQVVVRVHTQHLIP